jgi:hypothetical protein
MRAVGINTSIANQNTKLDLFLSGQRVEISSDDEFTLGGQHVILIFEKDEYLFWYKRFIL